MSTPYLTHLGPLAGTAKGSETLALAAKARQLAESGVEVFNFTVGEPDFDPPKAVIEAAHQAIDDGYHRYTAADGMASLKEAIQGWHRDEYGVETNHDQIVVSNGAKQAISQVLLLILSPGQEVIIPRPYWVSYPTMVRIAGGVPVFVDTDCEDGFAMDPDVIEAAITERTRAILINSPSNPSGAVQSRETIQALAQLVVDKDIWLIADDIYSSLVYDGARWTSPAMFPDTFQRTVAINGVSKAYAMTGWRIGWLVGPEHLARAVARLQSQLTSNPNAVAQRAATAALSSRSAQVALGRMKERFRTRRDLIVSLLNQIPGVRARTTSGAFYTFPDVSELMERAGIERDMDLCSRLIQEAHVVPVPGSAFGACARLRFSYATDEETIERGLEALHEWVLAHAS